MGKNVFALLAGLALRPTAAEQGPSGSSVQKVIKLLGSMAATCKKEKNEEEVSFAKFSTWCDTEAVNLANSIKDDVETLESLAAENGELKTDIKALGEAIASLEEKITKTEADKKEADAQRKKDHKAYVAESTDYTESLDALDRALATLAKTDGDKPAGAAALLQLSNSEDIPEKARKIFAAFVGMDANDGDEAPEANAYESQSGGIIDMLKNLEDDFREKLGQCQKEEMNSKAAYDMVVQDLVDTIANDKKDSAEKVQGKARKEEKVASNKKELESTANSKAEDEKTLADMEVECKEKKLSFGEKQDLRAEEIEAIEKAKDIMSSPDAAGNSETHFNLAQMPATSLAQLRSSGVRHRIGAFLRSEGARLHSKKMGLLAESIESDPFAKVKGMIDGMITKLLEEAKADADQEGFCDAEIGKSKITRNKLTEDIDALEAAIEEGKATALELADRIATLTKEIKDLDSALKEATALRAEEKARNAATIDDAKAGAAATQAATNVLKDFYEKAGQATGLVQTPSKVAFLGTEAEGIKMGTDEWKALANPAFEGTVDKGHKDGMQTFGKKYTGNKKSGGVLALLEVILSDFGNLQADTAAAETESQNSYDKFVTESNKNKAMKEKSIDMSTADKAKTESRVQEDTADLKSTQDELIAAERYYEKLVPQCIDQGMTFEERTAARESEIASLKEALKLLSGDA